MKLLLIIATLVASSYAISFFDLVLEEWELFKVKEIFFFYIFAVFVFTLSCVMHAHAVDKEKPCAFLMRMM